jgi:hypothetical protein
VHRWSFFRGWQRGSNVMNDRIKKYAEFMQSCLSQKWKVLLDVRKLTVQIDKLDHVTVVLLAVCELSYQRKRKLRHMDVTWTCVRSSKSYGQVEVE